MRVTEVKIALSGVTLKAMGWDTQQIAPEFGGALPWLWGIAEQKKRGRGFFRTVTATERAAESTLSALELKLDTLEEKSKEFRAIFKDAERVRAALVQFEEEE